MNQEIFDRSIIACALGPDLDSLPDGDMTEIGEKVAYSKLVEWKGRGVSL